MMMSGMWRMLEMTIGIKVAVCRVVVRKQGYSHLGWGGGERASKK